MIRDRPMLLHARTALVENEITSRNRGLWQTAAPDPCLAATVADEFAMRFGTSITSSHHGRRWSICTKFERHCTVYYPDEDWSDFADADAFRRHGLVVIVTSNPNLTPKYTRKPWIPHEAAAAGFP